MRKVALIIPTLNGGELFQQLLASLKIQTLQPCQKLIIDSGSNDKTVVYAKDSGFDVLSINREDFNHGATRQFAVNSLADNFDIVILMTQDAILADTQALEKLVACFDDQFIGAAYGRQIPRKNAGCIEEFSRLFNYPDHSIVKSKSDIETMGLKTIFCSDTFAAYRRSALLSAGGFPKNIIHGEDTYIAARMILGGWKVSYCAEAKVYHSHKLGYLDEFHRYFDTGVFHAREPWLRQNFGKAEGEGLRFVSTEFRFLLKHNFLLIPSAILCTGLKFFAYRLGFRERILPSWIKLRLSSNSKYWNQKL
jgi:rhamnosyltransferase